MHLDFLIHWLCGLSMSDKISLFSGVCSILLAAMIGVMQIHQNAAQARISRVRYAENVELQARKFIAEHYELRGLIPLCAIAVAYDTHMFYHRKMYNDFRLLSRDVQARIFEHCEWRMCDYSGKDFMSYCMRLLERATSEFLPNDHFDLIFNGNGKYMCDVLVAGGNQSLPHFDVRFSSGIANIILESFNNYDPTMPALGKIYVYYRFGDCDSFSACQTACTTALYIAVYAGQRCTHKNDDVDYGCPGGWGGEEIETLEDLFLQSLFYIWSSLHDVVNYKAPKERISLLHRMREILGELLLRPVVIINDLPDVNVNAENVSDFEEEINHDSN